MQPTIRQRAMLMLLGAAAVLGSLPFSGNAEPADPRTTIAKKGRSAFWGKNNAKFIAIFEHDSDFPAKAKLKGNGVIFHKSASTCYQFDVIGQPKRHQNNPRLLVVKVRVRKQPVICIGDDGKAPAVPSDPEQARQYVQNEQQEGKKEDPERFDPDLTGEGELTIMVEDEDNPGTIIDEMINVIGLEEDPCA